MSLFHFWSKGLQSCSLMKRRQCYAFIGVWNESHRRQCASAAKEGRTEVSIKLAKHQCALKLTLQRFAVYLALRCCAAAATSPFLQSTHHVKDGRDYDVFDDNDNDNHVFDKQPS